MRFRGRLASHRSLGYREKSCFLIRETPRAWPTGKHRGTAPRQGCVLVTAMSRQVLEVTPPPVAVPGVGLGPEIAKADNPSREALQPSGLGRGPLHAELDGAAGGRGSSWRGTMPLTPALTVERSLHAHFHYHLAVGHAIGPTLNLASGDFLSRSWLGGPVEALRRAGRRVIHVFEHPGWIGDQDDEGLPVGRVKDLGELDRIGAAGNAVAPQPD